MHHAYPPILGYLDVDYYVGCSGADFAEQSLFLNIASVLATYHITKAIGEDGKEIEPPLVWTTGLVSCVIRLSFFFFFFFRVRSEGCPADEFFWTPTGI